MKKIAISILLAICLIIAVTGCGNSADKYCGTYSNSQSGITVELDKNCVCRISTVQDSTEYFWCIKDDILVITCGEDTEKDYYAQLSKSSNTLRFVSDYSSDIILLTKIK